MGIKTSDDRIGKTSGETKKFDVEFDTKKELASGETLTTVNSNTVSPTGAGHLSIDAVVLNGAIAQVEVSSGKAPFTATADKDTDKITATAHGLSDDDRVHLVGCDLPGGTDEFTQYWVLNAAANDFALATCADGKAVDLTSNGSNFKVAYDYRVTLDITTSSAQRLIGEAIVELRE